MLLSSERLRIRVIYPDEVNQVADLLSNVKRMRLFFKAPLSREEIWEWMRQRDTLTLRLRSNGALAGACFIDPEDAEGNRMLHAVSASGSGLGGFRLALEGYRLGLRYAFEVMGTRRVVGVQFEGNRAAIALARAAGLRQEGIMCKAVFIDGEYRDLHLHALLREEWEAQCQQPQHQS